MKKRDDAGAQSPKERAAQEREERLRKQLRANLQRRKAQARSRNGKTDGQTGTG